MSRIAKALDHAHRQGRIALITYLTVGYPDLDATLRLTLAMQAGGVDIIELGIPFSDPLADGTTIQRASFHALSHGVTPRVCIDTVRRLRAAGLAVPLVLMGYYNPVLAYSVDDFARDARQAGADGLLIVDLPPDEDEGLHDACRREGLDAIYMLAPTSSEERIARVAAQASGFVYCVSLTGVTGARSELPPGLGEFLARVRRHTSLPLAVGFGISRREHMEAVASLGADAAVIGSAIIDLIDRVSEGEREVRLKEFVEVVAGRRGDAA